MTSKRIPHGDDFEQGLIWLNEQQILQMKLMHEEIDLLLQSNQHPTNEMGITTGRDFQYSMLMELKSRIHIAEQVAVELRVLYLTELQRAISLLCRLRPKLKTIDRRLAEMNKIA